MKLAVGTAQFGMPYGITNQEGQPSPNQCYEILDIAGRHGIKLIDTAAAYGTSEEVLGRILPDLVHPFLINTKIELQSAPSEQPVSLDASLTALGVSRVHSLMLHSVTDISKQQWRQLCALKDQHLVDNIGMSVYSPEEVETLLENSVPDVIQIPLNLFDQRFIQQDTITKLRQKGIEIHARSLFLQGVLLSDFNTLPDFFSRYVKSFEQLEQWRKKLNVSRLEMAMSLIHRVPDVDYFVVGVAHPAQLEEIIAAYHSSVDIEFDWTSIACNDANLLNPARWQLHESLSA